MSKDLEHLVVPVTNNTTETLKEALRLNVYYEALLDYLDDVVPCLSELIENFDESYGEE